MTAAPETELLADPSHLRGDARLIARALRERWEFPDGLLKSLPAALAIIVGKRTAAGDYIHTARERIAAARVLALMHAQNQRDDPLLPPPADPPAPQEIIHRIVIDPAHPDTARAELARRIARLGTNA